MRLANLIICCLFIGNVLAISEPRRGISFETEKDFNNENLYYQCKGGLHDCDRGIIQIKSTCNLVAAENLAVCLLYKRDLEEKVEAECVKTVKSLREFSNYPKDLFSEIEDISLCQYFTVEQVRTFLEAKSLWMENQCNSFHYTHCKLTLP